MRAIFKECRERANLSILQVSKALGVTRQAIYYAENGTHLPSLRMASRMCVLYNCSFNELIKGEKI